MGRCYRSRERLPAEAESDLRRAYLAELIDSLQALMTTFEEKAITYAERVRRQIRVATTDGRRIDSGRLSRHHHRARSMTWAMAATISPRMCAVGKTTCACTPDQVLETMRILTEEARSAHVRIHVPRRRRRW